MKIRRLIATSAVVVAAAGVLVAPANAYDGDWVINQQFERTTNPSFTPGFNPNDVDTALFQFDNRAKVLSLRLDFFQAPSDRLFTVYIGTFANGMCNATMTAEIASAPLFVTTPTTTPSRQWIPDGVQLVHTAVGGTPDGTGWRYDGLDANGYRWIRIIPGHYEDVPASSSVTTIDPNRYNRIAHLNVSGIDGELVSQTTVNNSDLSWSFTFSHPLLNRLGGTCADIYIPGRAAPYRIVSNVSNIPSPVPALAVAPKVVASGQRSLVLSPKSDKTPKANTKHKKKKPLRKKRG
jgi:hypothetical protein